MKDIEQISKNDDALDVMIKGSLKIKVCFQHVGDNFNGISNDRKRIIWHINARLACNGGWA